MKFVRVVTRRKIPAGGMAVRCPGRVAFKFPRPAKLVAWNSEPSPSTISAAAACSASGCFIIVVRSIRP